ncbi:hypothetical protein FB567DRAFT_85166 [Paraphoma chrysanthemicola]|uniref:Uncharacterized protein n=1 Tax=Paraphoma chrysanthemicola TaxID=798071 RepID=A0A8K0VX70_9PLEO|nr:hypothetical protein FB567DRAFT_85166 [Paraphoma chrysanthemicola]
MSLLLQAPAEIRNDILEYVLTGQTLRFLGLSPVDEQPFLINTSTNQPVNVLKHTCKQLSYELRGLQLQNNIIVFQQLKEEAGTPEVQLKLFCKHIPFTQLSRIRAVKVRPLERFSDIDILPSVRAYRSVLPPRVDINYIIWMFRFSPWPDGSNPGDAGHFLVFGLAIHIALKRSIFAEGDLELRRFGDTWGQIWHLAIWVATEGCHDIRVARRELVGVRFLPEEDSKTWEAIGEEMVRRMGSEKETAANVVEEWVRLERRWVEEGI